MKTKFLLTLLSVLFVSHARAYNQESIDIYVNGQQRNMVVFSPSSTTSNMPLLIVTHGMSCTPEQQYWGDGLYQLVDEEKFVAAYLRSDGSTWDTGGNKDLNFVNQTIDEMVNRFGCDRNRVYWSGFSMGSMLLFHGMPSMLDKIAAFAPTSGIQFSESPWNYCNKPVNLIYCQSYLDGTFDINQYHPDEYVKHFKDLNQCTTYNKTTGYTPPGGTAGTGDKEVWSNGINGSEVELFFFNYGSHWPSDANAREIWNFLKRFSLNSSTIASVEKPVWKTIYDDGDVAMGEWTGFINTMPAEMFKDVLPGDVVRVYIKDRTGGWQQGAFKNGATWDGLTTELGVIGLSDADFNKGYYEMTFDNNTLAQVQANGLIVSGCNYTATKVVLLKNETSLYNGNVAMGNWSGYINNLSPEMFADAKVGDNIRVYISNPIGDYQQGSFKNGSTWEGLNSDLDAFSLTGNDFGKGYFEMTLDENTLAQVKANGLIVSGCNYTASKVALIKNSYKEGAADAVLYDDGNVDMNEWTGFINTMGAGLFSDAKVGDNIRVYISNPTGGWQQGAFKNGSTWEGLTTELGVIGLTNEDFARGYYEMTLDENTLAQVKANGLIVSGCNYTASKVILIKNEAALYDNGSVDMEDWNGFINTMGANLFEDVRIGDKVRVYISNPTGDWQQGAFKNGANWQGLTDELGVIGLSSKDFEKGYYEMTFDENTLTQVQANGLIVSGCHYTADKVTLIRCGEGSNPRNSQGTNNIYNVNVFQEMGAANVYYNIGGQRLSKPQKGINIVNGKKIVVK